MPKIQYKEINFRGKSLDLINLVNQVINEYKNQGYELTLRQTYYQLVARGYIPNNERRDIQERLQMFGADVYVKRVALTMNQIETYNPPPNPAKLSDSRCGKYIDEYGDESWELDALEPSVITNLITNEVTAFRDDEIYQAVCDLEKRGKEELKMIERNYDRAVAFLESEV